MWSTKLRICSLITSKDYRISLFHLLGAMLLPRLDGARRDALRTRGLEDRTPWPTARVVLSSVFTLYRDPPFDAAPHLEQCSAKNQNWQLRMRQNLGGLAAKDQRRDAATAMGGHGDEIAASGDGSFDDGLIGSPMLNF
jgi:hypothetical protein